MVLRACTLWLPQRLVPCGSYALALTVLTHSDGILWKRAPGPVHPLNLRTYMFNLPRNKLRLVGDVTESLVFNERIPACIFSLVRDLIAFRFRSKVTTMRRDNVVNNSKRQYFVVCICTIISTLIAILWRTLALCQLKR